MRALVTGASGHIGSQVVRACADAGHAPVAFVRPTSDRRALEGLDVEVREGDLLDAESVHRAAAGAEVIFHVGAVHRNFVRDPSELMRPAVDGTRHVLAAARDVGARVVLTSSGATVGFSADPTRPLTEDDVLEDAEHPYTLAKIAAEKLALAADGVEVVVVNPSGVFGPGDHRVTPASAALVGLLKGDPAFLTVCVTDVRDVATAHVLAATKGQPGRRYLLTGDIVEPKELIALFDRLAGGHPPTFRPPAWLLSFLAGRMEKKATKTGEDAPLTRAMVRDVYGRHLVYDATRAREELGATFRPAESVLRDAFRWLLFKDALPPKVATRVRRALGPAAEPDADWRAR